MKTLTNEGKILKQAVEGFRYNATYVHHHFKASDAMKLLGLDQKETKKILERMMSDGMLTRNRTCKQAFSPYWYELTEKGEMLGRMA